MIPNRAPSTVWALRMDPLSSYVETMPDERVRIVVVSDDGLDDQTLELPRKDARLLAKRLHQCLDSTAKR